MYIGNDPARLGQNHQFQQNEHFRHPFNQVRTSSMLVEYANKNSYYKNRKTWRNGWNIVDDGWKFTWVDGL